MSFFFEWHKLKFGLMKDDIHKIGKDLNIVKEGSSAIFTVIGGAVGLNEGVIAQKAKVSEPKDSIEIQGNSKPWAIWGDNDSWPQDLQEDLDKLGVAKSALNISADLHYGSGIQWMKEKVDEEEGTLKHIISNPDGWRRYSNLSGFNVALSDAINSSEVFGLGFIRITMSASDTVYACKCLDTPSSRLGKRNTNGLIDKMFYGQDIHLKSDKDDRTVEYPLFDGQMNIKEFANKNKVFVIVIKYRSWGKFYYSEPDYYATFRNGWADIALEVPKLIKSIYANQATLKYHIKIPLSTFIAKYKDWHEKKETEQLKLFIDYRNEIEMVISRAESAGKSVFSLYNDTEKFDALQIEPIKNLLETTKDLPNNVAANSEILFGIGVDPSLLGLNMPGGKDLNGGGGSQRRESLKIKQATLTRERLVSMGFVWAVGILNGYDEELYPMYIDIDVSQTLDENPTGKKTVVGA